MSVGAIEKKRPLHGPGKEFADPSLLVCCELPAGEQQAEAVLLGQAARHVLWHDLAEVAEGLSRLGYHLSGYTKRHGSEHRRY